MVAHLLPKQRVAGSSPVSRSNRAEKGMEPYDSVPFLIVFPTRPFLLLCTATVVGTTVSLVPLTGLAGVHLTTVRVV